MKKLIKNMIDIAILLIIIGLILTYRYSLIDAYKIYVLSANDKLTLKNNDYYRNYNFEFIQNTTNFAPKNKQDIKNIFYTVINSGQDNFTFFCPRTYKDCIKEVDEIGNNSSLLSHINNFVHPYNGFKHLETKYDTLGRITIHIEKSYKKEDIQKVNEKVEEIYNMIPETDSIETKIRKAHNHIINISKYDKARSEQNIVNYKSDIAYGPLIEGYSLCGGYTDAMELLLEKWQVKSFKVSTENHVWNAVYINDKWLHLDLTWDDPVSPDGKDILDESFLLIDTNKLFQIETKEHNYDNNIYKELK